MQDDGYGRIVNDDMLPILGDEFEDSVIEVFVGDSLVFDEPECLCLAVCASIAHKIQKERERQAADRRRRVLQARQRRFNRQPAGCRKPAWPQAEAPLDTRRRPASFAAAAP